jgi:hypothetical protein
MIHTGRMVFCGAGSTFQHSRCARLVLFLKRVLPAGAIRPSKTLVAIVDRLVERDAPIGRRRVRFSQARRETLRRFELRATENLAFVDRCRERVKMSGLCSR